VGSIYIRSRLESGNLLIEVEDDGVGMSAANPQESAGNIGTGIGMANVTERLKVLYGDTAGMQIDSRPGQGTLVKLCVPVLQSVEGTPAAGLTAAAPAGHFDVRSNTQR
jgi:sensor histidine kinase YesM